MDVMCFRFVGSRRLRDTWMSIHLCSPWIKSDAKRVLDDLVTDGFGVSPRGFALAINSVPVDLAFARNSQVRKRLVFGRWRLLVKLSLTLRKTD